MRRTAPARPPAPGVLVVAALLAGCSQAESGRATADKEAVDAAVRRDVPALVEALGAEPPESLRSTFHECGGGYGMWTYEVRGQLVVPEGGPRRLGGAAEAVLADAGWTTSVRHDEGSADVAGEDGDLATLVQVPGVRAGRDGRVVAVHWSGPRCVNYSDDDEALVDGHTSEELPVPAP